MLKAKSRWQLATYDESLAEEIATTCGISPLIGKLLVIRGIDSVMRAKAFLQVGPEQFHDPFLLDGMEQAVQRIRQAVEREEPICIYGDYDADGVSSTALMIHLMRQLGAKFDTYIPNRFREGYGLNNDALSQIAQTGFKLVITVDTGISAVEQAAFARELGLDLIITDHHEPPAVLPEALAVINPKKPQCSYPFDMLAGVGVAFKLAHALLSEPPLHLIDLAAIGTIADLVPLVDENRVLASMGLRRLNQTQHVGLQSLIRVCGLSDTELTSGHVGFALGPRINAGGRLETADAALKLLASNDVDEADRYAQMLDQLNSERQELVQQMTEEAIFMVNEHYPPDENGVLVVAKEGWNVGVVGIVASRLVEKFYRPTIVLGIDPEKGTAKGSARSIVGFDMYEALTACKELLPHYGGHTMAAGMTLPTRNLDLLRAKLNQVANDCLTPEDFIPLTKVDLSLDMDQIDVRLAEELDALAPFGMGNPTPLVLLNEVEATGVRLIGRDEAHLKCTLKKQEKLVDAIGFQFAYVSPEISPKARLQVLGELSINEWNGNRKPQVTIRDMAVPHQQIFDWRGMRDKQQKWQEINSERDVLTVCFYEESYRQLLNVAEQSKIDHALIHNVTTNVEKRLEEADSYRKLILYDLPRTRAALRTAAYHMRKAERIYCMFGDANVSFDLLHFPSRDQFKSLYQFFCGYPVVSKKHLEALAKKQQLRTNVLEKMLTVFIELGFLQEDTEQFMLHTEPAKKPLESSVHYREWQEEMELATDLLLSSYDVLVKYLNESVELTTV